MPSQPEGFEVLAARLGGRLSRRDVLRRALALGLSAPVVGGLLAACGGDDDDDEATATATSGTSASPTTAAATPTTATTGASPTAAASPTTAEASPTTAQASPTSATGGEGVVDGGDRLMGKQVEDAGREGGTLIEGGSQDLRTVNPIIINDGPSYNFNFLIFEGLWETNPDTLEPVGNLAASWEVNADATAITVNLRDGVTWHDGEPFTADDVKFTYELHMDGDSGSSFTGDFTAKIKSIDVIDDLTVALNFNSPLPDFMVDTGFTMIIAQHIWGDIPAADVMQHPGSTGGDPSMVIGTGPFKFKEWVTSDHASCVRNDDYWDGTPHLDEYVYKVVADDTAVIQQLKTGEIDIGQSLASGSVGELEGIDDLSIIDQPTFGFTILFTNLDTEKTPLFQDVQVRQALMVSLDRQAMVDEIRFGYGEVAIGTMPTMSWAYDPDAIEEKYEYDPDRAMALLEEAGWVDADGDGVREKGDLKLSFTMKTLSGVPEYEGYAAAMQEYWKQVGIDMTPELKPLPEWIAECADAHDYEAALIGFGWTAGPDQSPMFHSASYAGGFNIMKYSNPEVDAVLEEAKAEPDQAKRKELYNQYQNLLMADLPSLVIDFPRYVAAVNTRVHNYFPNSVNERFNSETWWLEG